MYSPKDMYRLALAKALKNGPGIIPVNGERIACYYLNRKDTEDLFEDNHFKLTRCTWRDDLEEWPRYGAVVPKEALNPEFRMNWFIIFKNIDKDCHLTIRMMAEDSSCGYYPKNPEGVGA